MDKQYDDERLPKLDSALVIVCIMLCAVAAGIAALAPWSYVIWAGVILLAAVSCGAILYWRDQKRRGYF
jgi:hypothetical protein